MSTRFNDGSFQVASHKTSESGPAVFGLSAEVYHQITRYVAMLDLVPGYTSDCNRTIFINWPTSKGVVTDMTSSHVNKSIQRFWGRGTSGTKKLTATRLRKATSTTVRKKHPEIRDRLACHMTHKPETADRYYQLHNQREMAVEMTQLIASVMETKVQVILISPFSLCQHGP